MAATDARAVPKKNTAYRHYFVILDADGDPVSGATALDSEVSIDGAAFDDCTNEATEIGTSGFYYLDLTAAEMNGDAICVRVQTTTSGAKTEPIILYPEEAGDIRVNVTQVNGNTTAATNAGLMFDGTGYAGGTTKLDVGEVTGSVAGNVDGVVAGISGTIQTFDALKTDRDADWSGLEPIETGTLQSATATTAVLDDAPTTIVATADRQTDDFFNRSILAITSGTGAGQQRKILDYVYTGPSTYTTTVRAWAATPDATSTYEVLPDDTEEEEIEAKIDTIDDLIDTEIGTLATNLATVDTVVDSILALLNDAAAEPTSVPAANASRAVKIDFLYTYFRNAREQTATTYTHMDDAGAALFTKTFSNDGTTATSGKATDSV